MEQVRVSVPASAGPASAGPTSVGPTGAGPASAGSTGAVPTVRGPARAGDLRELVQPVPADQAADARWDAFVAGSPDGHIMQASRWGRHKAAFGWDLERVALVDGDRIVAGSQILYRSLPLGLSRLAYVAMGPVVDWEDGELVDRLLSSTRAAVRRRGAFCLTVEPSLPGGAVASSRLAAAGFSPTGRSVQWRSTIVVDVDCTDDELMARLHPDHRHKVRKAARQGVTVRPGTAEELAAFHALLRDTAGRKEFAVYPEDYYRRAYDLFVAPGAGQFLVAEHEGKIVAGNMLYALGDRAYYMYAATSTEHRKLNPAYLLVWEALRWARGRGCVTCDCCGIPDEVGTDPERYAHDERHDGLWGVYRFKRGFGGQVVSYAGSHDQVYNRRVYAFYNRAVNFLHSRLGENWNRKLFRG